MKIRETLDATYVKCDGGSANSTPLLRSVSSAGPLKKWGPALSHWKEFLLPLGYCLSRELIAAPRRAASGLVRRVFGGAN